MCNGNQGDVTMTTPQETREQEIGRRVLEIIGAHHVIERTSELGTDWIGTCRLCGRAGLRMHDKTSCPHSPSDDTIENFLRFGPSLGYE